MPRILSDGWKIKILHVKIICLNAYERHFGLIIQAFVMKSRALYTRPENLNCYVLLDSYPYCATAFFETKEDPHVVISNVV